MHEMQVKCVQTEINPNQKVGETVYYFAQRGKSTRKLFGLDVPGHYMYPIALVSEPLTTVSARALKGHLKKYVDLSGDRFEKLWGPNDGFVNLEGQSAPTFSPSAEGTWETDFKPGIWYNMPPEHHDHMSWNGMSLSPWELFRIWDRMVDNARKLPDGEDVI